MLEPALEEQVGLLNAEQILRLAKLYGRWERQLRVKARIMLTDAKPIKLDPLRRLPKRVVRGN